MTSLLIAAQTAAQTSSAELSVWDLCLKGGIIMIPLALLSLVSIYIFFERWFALRKAAKDDDTFMKRIKDYIHDGEIESADMLCKKTATPYARLIQKGISRIGRPMNDVLVAIENVGNIEVAKLGKGFTWLATTAADARIPRHGNRYGESFLRHGKRRSKRQHLSARRRHLRGSDHNGCRTRGGHHRSVCLQLSVGTREPRDEPTREQDNGIYGPAQRAGF